MFIHIEPEIAFLDGSHSATGRNRFVIDAWRQGNLDRISELPWFTAEDYVTDSAVYVAEENRARKIVHHLTAAGFTVEGSA